LKRLLLAPVLPALFGCGEDFTPQHELESLRVLAVKKDPPYAAPGDIVQLSMLSADARGEDRPVRDHNNAWARRHIHWFSGCYNPFGGAYALCYPQLIPAFTPLLQGVDEPPEIPFRYGRGNHFALQVPADGVLQPPIDAQQPRSGTGYVFFAVCDGTLTLTPAFEALIEGLVDRLVDDCLADADPTPACAQPILDACPTDDDCTPQLIAACAQDPGVQECALGSLDDAAAAFEGFPLLCQDEDGNYLGADDYVAGYTQVFIYDEITNQNPAIDGIEFKGQRIEFDGARDWEDCSCLDDQCVGDLAADPPIPEFECRQPDPGNSSDSGPDIPSVPACEDDGDASCPEHSFKPVISRDSAEVDAALGSRIREQVWVNYYVDRGGLTRPLRLLNDAERGWSDDYETGFLAPKEPGRVNLWAVVHDNRGGTSWVRQTIEVTE